ncbi:hypothetical protein C2W62_36485 [Candidatus Entotheonella serta]|nr:hypothetical protein C2W62_36485 [Candidatus Entotheonella serta]
MGVRRAATDMSVIRILTANLCNGQADPAALIDLIEHLQVDVVCVQELRPRLAKPISQVLAHGQLGAHPYHRELGIACRYEAEVKQFPLPRRPGWVARLSPAHWPQLHSPIEIVNVHIMAPHMRPYARSLSLRRGQLAGLLHFLAQEPDVPRAILGDFNASPLWPLYRRLASRFTDAATAVVHKTKRPRPTWPHIPALRLNGLFRIDHCFLSRLSASRVEVIPISGSDHLGLYVEVMQFRNMLNHGNID